MWLKDLTKLEDLLDCVKDEDFRKDWAAVKQANKERLAHHMQVTLGLKVNTKAMFDVQIKRLHKYKRQTLNILGVIHHYLVLKSMTPEERKKLTPRNVFFAGKAAPGYYITKPTICLIVNVAHVVNADPETKDYLNIFFLPDYSVTLAEVLIPASDISQHISTCSFLSLFELHHPEPSTTVTSTAITLSSPAMSQNNPCSWHGSAALKIWHQQTLTPSIAFTSMMGRHI
ncbi:carbohydrate phosphorylase-domain-containing protein [Suillus ampliporus]|nr:carbohydrate phosphorylase-domain-containing protein [Suillus ampliporus]